MTIIESFVQAKTGRSETCEDLIFFNEHFCAIIDGATSKSDAIFPDGKTSGKLGAELAYSTLTDVPCDIEAPELFIRINSKIADFYKTSGLYERMKTNPMDRCTIGGMAVYSFYRKEVWFLGDCQALIGHRYICDKKKIDDLNAQARAFFLESELASGKTVEDLILKDPGREFIRPLLQRQSYFQNASSETGWEFYCIDGFFTKISTIHTEKISNEDNLLILASDGYPKIFPTLKETEEYLAKVLKKDPLMFRQSKSTKGLEKGNCSFDDRVFVCIIP